MKKPILLIFTLCLTFSAAHSQTASEIIERTIEAMGGASSWSEVDFIQSKHVGHKHWLEQSENPNGPFITSYEVVEEIRGVHEAKLSRKESMHMFQSKNAVTSQVMINGDRGTMQRGDRTFPLPYQLKTGHDEWMRYAPERLILDAQEATLNLEGVTDLEGTPHYVVTYTADNLRKKLYINQHTLVLGQAEIETYLPHDIFHFPWGKFTTKIKYSLHWLYPGGFRYPAQWDIYKLGKKFRSATIIDIDFNPEVDPELFKIPDNLPTAPAPSSVNNVPLKTEGIIAAADHIHTIPGMWYVGHIEQQDGILVIEGPISSGYNEQHIDFLKKKYPNKPIKGVFATSDAWPHVGGIRPFAAQGTPIYTHKLNKNIIENMLQADHSPDPDAYEKNRVNPMFRLVNQRLRIDDTETPVEVIPVNGEGGERMIALYMPEQKVLYASDLVQYNARRKQFFSAQYLSEVKKIVDEHQLEVETVFAMHTSPLPWSEVLEALKTMTK